MKDPFRRREEVWEQICDTPAGGMLLPGDLIARLNMPADDVKSVLMDAVQALIIEPVYNYNTDEALSGGVTPEWTTDLVCLRRVVITASGRELDGRDPKAIRVAFRRTYCNDKAL